MTRTSTPLTLRKLMHLNNETMFMLNEFYEFICSLMGIIRVVFDAIRS